MRVAPHDPDVFSTADATEDAMSYRPALHTVQEDAPSDAVERPRAQSVHDVLPVAAAYLPTGHGRHSASIALVAPSGAYRPAAQTVPLVHALRDPGEAAYVPAGHAAQSAADSSEHKHEALLLHWPVLVPLLNMSVPDAK